MIYLDYSATTKVNPDVLESFNKVSKEYFGNPNSIHKLGVKSANLISEATKQIASLLHIKEDEIIYTSSATEANNIAIINTCLANPKLGKHIITSKLEHPSIYKIMNYLESIGYKIDYVKNNFEGLIDFDDLKKLIKEDTVLVSICGVNSEVGIRQPLKLIKQFIKIENPNTIFHSDVTQGMGKVNINLNDVDLATFTAHKFYGPMGIAVLYKSDKIKMKPFVYGSDIDNIIGGTPNTALIVSLSKALRLALESQNKKEELVKKYNDKICKYLSKYDDIVINKTNYSIPHILNISIPKIKPETLIHYLEEYDIYVSSNTACSKGEMSNAVYALTNDKKLAMSTIRISLSHLTSNDEINTFLNYFDEAIKKLIEFGEK